MRKTSFWIVRINSLRCDFTDTSAIKQPLSELIQSPVTLHRFNSTVGPGCSMFQELKSLILYISQDRVWATHLPLLPAQVDTQPRRIGITAPLGMQHKHLPGASQCRQVVHACDGCHDFPWSAHQQSARCLNRLPALKHPRLARSASFFKIKNMHFLDTLIQKILFLDNENA